MVGFNMPVKRGDILVFYPPAEVNKGKKELKYDPFSLFSRWTGLPFLPQDDAYIKRVIGLPGDLIEIKNNAAVCAFHFDDRRIFINIIKQVLVFCNDGLII